MRPVWDCKHQMKNTGREINKVVAKAVNSAKDLQRMYMDTKRRCSHWRQQAYKNETEIKRLKTELSEVRASESKSKRAANDALSELSRKTWMLEKAGSRLEAERGRAQPQRAGEQQDAKTALLKKQRPGGCKNEPEMEPK